VSDPLLSKAITDSSDIVQEIAALTPGRTILSFYVALLRLAKTMEGMYPELRDVRDPVLACGDARAVTATEARN
jgi:hypothetical protein